MMLEK
jgi:hypothetical protein